MEEIRLERVMALFQRRLLATLAVAAALSLVVGFAQRAADGSSPTSVGPAEEMAGPARSAAEGGTGPLSVEQRRHLTELLVEATIRVTTRACGTKMIGTGFAFGDMVVTNSHVVGDATRFTIDRPDRTGSMSVSVVGRRPSVDLAFGSLSLETASSGGGLSVPERLAAAALTTASDHPMVGEPVLMAGYGGGRRLSILEASVHAVVDGAAYGTDGQVVLLDRATTVGFSGGPVVDRQGRVVGVLRAYDSLTGLTVVAPAAMLSHSAASDDMQVNESTCN